MAISIFMDGQFGSCGKGAVISALSQVNTPQAVVRVGGPQAGHSMIGPCPESCDRSHPSVGHPRGWSHIWKMRQIPAAWHSGALCVIGRGAMIDLEVLENEIVGINSTIGISMRLWVDASATIVEEHHKEMERSDGFGESGSTREGVGAARAELAMRKTRRVRDVVAEHQWLEDYMVEDSAKMLRSMARSGADIWIEGTQGFGLSLLASGEYPFVTSANITPQQMLADVGLHWDDAEIRTHMLFRTFPIRIAGNSGPLDEIEWDQLPIPPAMPERTTVTNKVRRIGRFDFPMAQRAIDECRPTSAIITFLDYLQEPDRKRFVDDFQEKLQVPVSYASLGFEQLVPVLGGV